MAVMNHLPPANRPRHIAIIMDGNGRWARQRFLPRPFGHREGVKAVRRVVNACVDRGIEILTLFAFSSENWRRPSWEVNLLMRLFLISLRNEINALQQNNVRIRFVGDRSAFSAALQAVIQEAEIVTAANTAITLVIAANYGGRWDIVQAARRLAKEVQQGVLTPEQINAEQFDRFLSLYGLPEPDLFIRTGGEQRISNFLLWQLAYTELYFTDRYWPDFDAADLDQACAAFAQRQRRFGQTGEQVEQVERGRSA
ncbi:MAG TPA: polyprenyl diphosphate synthase [Candidatus Competibacteraceae bacterium]|nr:polyprenyl diphosphate synthase [Candidatus Competibacteraceae bacterium]